MKKKDLFSSTALVVLLTQSSVVLAQDEPDLRTESRLHYIYKKYNQAPTPREKWEEALGRARDNNYTIQKGDTLWDISETFFGDPHFWPKIWSVNSQIQNPHEILPKGAVQFIPGTSAEPPQMGLAKADEKVTVAEPAPPPKPPAEEEGVNLMPNSPKQKHRFVKDIDLSKIQIPPPVRPARPISQIPGSLPRYIYYRDAIRDAKLEISPIHRVDAPTPIDVQYFASDSEPSAPAEIVEIENGSPAAGEGASVLVRGEGLSTGAKMMAFETLGSIRDGSGKVNRVEGILEVGGVVNSSKGIFRAKVIKSYSLVMPGAKVSTELPPSALPGDGAPMSQAAAQITGGQHSQGRTLFGPYSIVFLSAGSGGGLQVGSHLPVYRNPKSRVPNSLLQENPAEIGELQVVKVDNDVATAIVLRAVDEIRVGDVTSPALQ